MGDIQHKQRGFGFVGLLLAVVVIGAIVFVGVKVMDMRNAASVVSDSSGSTSPSVPAKISSKADLQNAASALDAANVNSVDVTQLDSDLSALL